MMDKDTVCLKLQQADVCPPGSGRAVLRDLSLQVGAGEWIGLVGRSGSGKSLLSRVLAGLQPVTAGLQNIHPSCRPISLIMQNPDAQWVGETVYEDVCFGMENRGVGLKEMRMRCKRALELVGLAGLENRKVHQLSGGQKQLLALAGAIVLEPKVLIADEATSMLDPVSRERVIAVLQALRSAGATIILASQILEELAYADRVVAIHNGGIAYDGGVREFFYGGKEEGCFAAAEHIGLLPPLTVRTVQALRRRGLRLDPPPLTPEELVQAVGMR